MNKQSHIFLCGFMGSGKSTLGKKTAPLLNLEFFDLDEFIETNEGQKISVIFEKEGELGFRKKEKKYLQQLLKHKSPLLIALGGGTVCFEDNLEIIKKNGLLLYIELSEAALKQRLQENKTTRPLLAPLNDDELEVYIKNLMGLRKQFYQQAHKTVPGINLNAKQLFSTISELL